MFHSRYLFDGSIAIAASDRSSQTDLYDLVGCTAKSASCINPQMATVFALVLTFA